MIITNGIIYPKELRIHKKDLIDIFLKVYVEGKNYRLKGLDSDIVFLNSISNYPDPANKNEIIIEVEQWL